MEMHTFFASVGGDYEAVLRRLPSESMIRRFVGKFRKDPSYCDLKRGLAEGDLTLAFRAAHTLKGTAANLGLDTLAGAASDLTEQLRNASGIPEKGYIEAVDWAYQMTVEKIEQISD